MENPRDYKELVKSRKSLYTRYIIVNEVRYIMAAQLLLLLLDNNVNHDA